jgi:phage tail-like protein
MASNNNPGKRKVPFPAYFFTVSFDQKSGLQGFEFPFRSCSGLKVESAVVEVEEGGFNSTTRKLVGRTKYANIVLKQGFCGADSPLYRLRTKFMNDLAPKNPDDGGKTIWKGPNRFGGTITQMGPDGAKAKWAFFNGWICKWEGPDLDASKNELSIESIEIAHEGLVMLAPPAQQGGAGSSPASPSGSGTSSGSSSGSDSGSGTSDQGGT